MSLTADIDGTDITEFCQTIRWRPRLNLLDSGVVRYPGHLHSITPGVSELHLYLDASLVFSGPCWYSQAEGGPDSTYAEVTGWDHRIYLGKRQCKTTSGNLITPGTVLTDEVTAPAILAAYVENAISDSDASGSAALPLSVGVVESGGADVSGIPMAFPMTIERMRSLLTSTGQLDQVLTPGIGGSTLDLLNEYENDISGSVSYEYATGLFNAQVATLTVDMKDVWNAIWYLLSPRCTETRWKGSITPTAPHVGGTWPGDLVDRFEDSRDAYGYMQLIRIFDDNEVDCVDPEVGSNAIRPLFEEEWANETWVAAVPRTFVSIRPERGSPTPFRVGDLIGVAAGVSLHGGFSGTQRVYGFDLTTDFDGIDTIDEILTSADQEGAPGA